MCSVSIVAATGKRNFEIVCLSTFLVMIAVVVGHLGWYWRLANPGLVLVGICKLWDNALHNFVSVNNF